MGRTLRALTVTLALIALPARAAAPEGTITTATRYGYEALVKRVETAVAANGMTIVARASASIGAAQRGLTIPGDAVLMVFRNDFAVRMLAASPEAGIEAPIRFHVSEAPDGKASLAYRRPSAIFAPYGREGLGPIAAELDAIFDKIFQDATAP